MKTQTILSAIAIAFAAASGAALAQEATYEYPQAVKSQTTRAAVQAEVLASRANRALLVHERSFQQEPRFNSVQTRDGVRAEARVAQRSGQIAALTAEPHGFDAALPVPKVLVSVAAE